MTFYAEKTFANHFIIKRRTRIVILSALLIFCISTVCATAQEKREVWYFGNNVSSPHDEDAVALCKSINVSTSSTVYYNGAKFDPVESGLRTETSYTCKDTDYPQGTLHAIDLTMRCGTFNSSGNVTSFVSGKCPVDYSGNSCPRLAGNPTNIYTVSKEEHAVDWVSPREPRFIVARTYSSNAASFKELNYPEYIRGLMSFGGPWRGNYDEFISEYGSSARSYRPYDGRVIPLPTLNSVSETKAGYPFKVIRPNQNQPYYWIEDGSGKRMRFQRYPSRTTLALIQITWPDGYTINIERATGNFAIQAVSDNKGNRAVYTLSGATTSSSPVTRTTKVEIDTSYNGASFDADIELLYEYQSNDVVSGWPMVSTVVRNDTDSSLSQVIGSYNYFDTKKFFPPLLTGVSDGNLDGSSTATLRAAFSYRTYGLEIATNPPNPSTLQTERIGDVMVSSHPDGVDNHAFASTSTAQDKSVFVKNPFGLETRYDYEIVDGYKMITGIEGAEITNCLGTTRSLSYTPNAGGPLGFVYSKVERNGSQTNYTRDARGLILTKTEDAAGSNPRVSTYTWHSTLRLPLTKATPGLLETYTYTTEGLTTSYSQKDTLAGSPTYNQTRTWTYTYTTLTSGLKVLTSVDGPGLSGSGISDVTTYSYTSLGELTSVTDANGLVTTIVSRDEQGQPTVVEQPDLSRWTFTYDRMGRVQTAGFAGAGQPPILSSFTHDISGRILSYTNSRGKTWSFTYDASRRLSQVIAPSGAIADYSYDVGSNPTRVEYRDGTGPVQFWEGTEFDELSRVLKSTGAMGQEWSFSHDKEDNLTDITDPLTFASSNGFDGLNRMINTVDRESFTTQMAHDAHDRMTTFTDPRAISTSFTYNGFGEVITEASADRGTISYAYDQRGLVTSRTDGRGITVNYSYDNGSRLTLIDYPAGSIGDIAFTWDQPQLGVPANANKGHMGRIDDGTIRMDFGHEVTVAGPRVSVTALYPASRSYTVIEEADFEGNPTRRVYPSGREIHTDVDDDNRITRIRVKDGAVWTTLLDQITYAPNGPMTSALYGDGFTQTRSYDQSYRLTGMLDTDGVTVLRQLGLGYEGRDNLTAVTDALVPANSETFGYTPRESLASASGPYGVLGFTYDGVGNRIAASSPSGTDSYAYPATSNRLDLITLASADTHAFTYDGAGSVTSEAMLGGSFGYTYNAAGRMETSLANGVLQASYTYDAMGRQAIRTLTSGAVTIHSVFDSEGRRIAEYNEATGDLIREYVWNGWDPIAVIEGGVISFIRADHIGRPVFATDASGVKVWSAVYTPFGGVHTQTGTPVSARFPGQWFQAENGLHQNWMRDYDPTTGRYMQTDPLGLIAGMSVYGYANQSPMMYLDPNGENPFLLGAAIGGGLALLSELWRNDGRWECINWFNVGVGAGLGAVGGAFAGGLFKGLGAAHRGGDAAARSAFREAFAAGADDVVHHGLVAANRGVNGVGPSLRHHFMNLKLVTQSVHKRVHGKWDRVNNLPPYVPLGRYWHGTPGWFHGATGFPFLGGLAELLDGKNPCACEN